MLAILCFCWTLALAAAVSFSAYKFLSKIFDAAADGFTRYLTTSIEIHTSFGYDAKVLEWLKRLIELNCDEKLNHFGITNDIICSKNGRGRYDEDSSDGEWESENESVGIETPFNLRKQLAPIQNSQSVVFRYKRTWIRITRNIDPHIKSHFSPMEVYKITAYFTKNKQLLIDMLDEGREMVEKKRPEQINFYRADSDPSWCLIKKIKPRDLSSIVLKEGITDAIQKDLQEFIKSKRWYKERGIPFRRGYLLYGPPGCGKTSFVKAIAGQIGYDVHEIQLSNRNLNDECLTTLMSTIGKKGILLFEDIDAVFAPRPKDEQENSDDHDGPSGKLKVREAQSSISFSGLINAIDGVASEEDYILFMTTNHIDMLDSALIRPGRIDMRQFIDYPDEQQILDFFKKFYPDCNDGVAEKFAKAVRNLKCNPSVAQIQGIFLNHKHDPKGNLLDVDTLIEVCKDNNESGFRNIYV